MTDAGVMAENPISAAPGSALPADARPVGPAVDPMADVVRRRSQPGYWTKVRLKAGALKMALKLLAATLRLRRAGWEQLDALRAERRTMILAIFHGSQLIPLYLMRNRGITVMASLSSDGDFTTTVLESLGYRAARGSSSRGGARALLEMVKVLRGGTDVAFTVDGPRGPRHVCKPGIVLLAQKSGSPIVPLGIAYARARFLKIWDRFTIPLPFTPAFFQVGRPFTVDPGLPIDEGCRLVEDRLNAAMAEAADGLRVSAGAAAAVPPVLPEAAAGTAAGTVHGTAAAKGGPVYG